MNVANIYEAVLTEINKDESPSFILKDFIYFLNKAIQQYQNKMYNAAEMSQQKTDDLIAFYKEVRIETNDKTTVIDVDDYCHSFGCDIEFVKNNNCTSNSKVFTSSATKYTSNMNAASLSNYYFKPAFKRPYYKINNVRKSSVSVNIDVGDDDKYLLKSITFKYLISPKLFTIDDIDLENETGTELEYSDYVCFEIINELLKLILENSSDPRLQSNLPINQSILNPLQK